MADNETSSTFEQIYIPSPAPKPFAEGFHAGSVLPWMLAGAILIYAISALVNRG